MSAHNTAQSKLLRVHAVSLKETFIKIQTMNRFAKFILLILTFPLFSFTTTKGYEINGKLTGFPDSTKIYLRDQSTEKYLDSALIIRNEFQLKGQLKDEPEDLWLISKVDGRFIITNLLIGNETVSVKGDINDFPLEVKISGSGTQDENYYYHHHFKNLIKPFNLVLDSLKQSYSKLSKVEKQEKGKAIRGRIKNMNDTIRFIQASNMKSHINTYPGIIELGYLKNSFPRDTVQALYNKLSDEIKASKYARIVQTYLKVRISAVGDEYQDFEAFDKNGKKIKFSDLAKRKYVLLDFTADGCVPCAKSVEELKLIDKTYSDSLVVVSFSCDIKRDDWIKSLERDNITWPSLWDGKGINSETALKFGVVAVPGFFLINPQGVIIDKVEGYVGKGSLENKLSKFKNN